MKDHTCQIGIITIATLILSVHCHINIECGRLSYRKPMSNKPDIIVAQYFEEARPNKSNKSIIKKYEYVEPDRHFGICHFRSNDTNKASTLVNYDFYQKNKLVYDSQMRTLYSAFGLRIHKIQRDHNSATQLFDSPKIPYRTKAILGTSTETVAIAYDWITKNFYVGNRLQINLGNLDDDHASIIFVHGRRKNDRVRRTIRTDPEELGRKVAEMNMREWEPRDDMKLIVHPNRGYVFVKLNSQKLLRMDQDGKNRVFIRNYENITSVAIRSIAMDYYTDRLYILETKQEADKNVTQIYHSNLDGEDVVTLKMDNSHAHYVPVMAVDKDYVYYAISKNDLNENYSIFRAGKSDGALDIDFEISNTNPTRLNGTYKLDEIIVSIPQEGMENHPCSNNKGGCSVHCVAVPGADMKLTNKCVS